MKKISCTLFILIFVGFRAFSTDYNINISGFTYVPASLSVLVGDNITIQASSTHPLVQVDKATWDVNGSTPMTGGWGSKTSNFTYTAIVADTIYFVCSNHVSSGMKGKIVVNAASGINENTSSEVVVTIYPNPASWFLNFKITGKTSEDLLFEIYDLTGTLVMNLNLNALKNSVADISQLKAGIYFYYIKCGSVVIRSSKLFITR